MVLQLNRAYAVAAAVALVAGTSSMIASAVELTAADCADLAALPTSDMTEDVNLFLDDAIEFTCDTPTTVIVKGNHNFRVTSDNFSVKFTNVRFEIGSGADFSLNLAVGENLGTATFTGVTDLESNGGAFSVESGSSATFGSPMAFEGNSVTARFSGGAVYAGGKVSFEHSVDFTDNAVLRFDDYDAGDGGAVAVGPEGQAAFEDFSYFTSNLAESGGQGGALANSGSVVFGRASYFVSNIAKENGDENGGHGGAIFTAEGSTTVFERRTIMRFNEGASGGALYNLGTTTLESAGFFRGNEALGTDRAEGGHIYTTGAVSISLDADFREGFSRGDGGAIYIDTGGSVSIGGAASYIDNSASEDCDDVFARGQSPVCHP